MKRKGRVEIGDLVVRATRDRGFGIVMPVDGSYSAFDNEDWVVIYWYDIEEYGMARHATDQWILDRVNALL